MSAAYGSAAPQVLEIMGDSIRVRREN